MVLTRVSIPEDAEEVISDLRLSVVLDRLHVLHPDLPDDTDMATFIQPPKFIPAKNGWTYPMAVFLVVSDNPKYPGHRVATHGTVALMHFRQSEKVSKHYVRNGKDVDLEVFKPIVRRHLQTLRNLRDLIH